MSTAPASSQSGIDLYSFPTPNGVKITIALEGKRTVLGDWDMQLNLTMRTTHAELRDLGSDIKWTEHRVDISKNESKEQW